MGSHDFDLNMRAAKFESDHDYTTFIARAARTYRNSCATDCSDAVYDSDENFVMSMLVLLGNKAREAYRSDTDDKLAFVDFAATLIDIMINDRAKDAAELQWEHRDD